VVESEDSMSVDMSSFWRGIGRLQATHVVMLRDAGMIDDEALAGLLEAIEHVRGSVSPDVTSIIGAIRSFDERLDSNLPPGLRGTNRVGRGTIDLAAALVRIDLRESLLGFGERVAELRAALIELASAHLVTLLPMSVDRQVAQPTTFGHLLASTVSQLGRAETALSAAYELVNRSPLGSGALASSGMPIDRERLTDLAGFDGLIENTLDAVSAVDHVTAIADAVELVATPLRRLLGEMLDWIRVEPASFRFGDEWTSLLSDLPQARIATGVSALGADLHGVSTSASTLRSACHELGFGPVAAELDRLAGLGSVLIARADDAAERALALFTSGIEVNRALLVNRAGKGFSTSSDLADFLMIEEQIEPGAAQNIAALTISRAREQGLEAAGITVDLIDGAALLVIGREIKVEFEAISRYLAPRRFIERRTAPGGPSPATVRAHLDGERARLAEDIVRRRGARERLVRADAELDRIVSEAALAGG
jgi:argininosuccinate lyase